MAAGGKKKSCYFLTVARYKNMRSGIVQLICFVIFLITSNHLQAQLQPGQKIKVIGNKHFSQNNFGRGNLFSQNKTIRVACTIQELATLPEFISQHDSLEEIHLFNVYDTINGKKVFYLPQQFGNLSHLKN